MRERERWKSILIWSVICHLCQVCNNIYQFVIVFKYSNRWEKHSFNCNKTFTMILYIHIWLINNIFLRWRVVANQLEEVKKYDNELNNLLLVLRNKVTGALSQYLVNNVVKYYNFNLTSRNIDAKFPVILYRACSTLRN